MQHMPMYIQYFEPTGIYYVTIRIYSACLTQETHYLKCVCVKCHGTPAAHTACNRCLNCIAAQSMLSYTSEGEHLHGIRWHPPTHILQAHWYVCVPTSRHNCGLCMHSLPCNNSGEDWILGHPMLGTTYMGYCGKNKTGSTQRRTQKSVMQNR